MNNIPYICVMKREIIAYKGYFKEFFEKYPVFILSNEKINGFSLKFQREFEKNKKNLTYYQTPYGQMLIGVNTRHLQVDFEEGKIAAQIDYELDVNHEPMADCKIRMNIVSKDSGKFSVLS